jgi:peptide/nickel transport system permease protein
MAKYAARRLLIAIPTLWIITIMTFLVVNLAPGDPLVGLMLVSEGASPASMPPEYIASLREKYGLDRPMVERYGLWLKELAKGNLGMRYGQQQTVVEAIEHRLPYTLQLMGAAIGLAIVVGIPLGVISALHQYRKIDYTLTVVALGGISIPEFLVGIFCIYTLSVKLHLFPAGGTMTPGGHYNLVDNLHHLAMPAVALGMGYVSTFMRYTRSSVLDVLNQEHVTTARAKGLAHHVVISGHVLRNALLPLITVGGLMVPSLLAGSVVVESVFNWPGMGLLYLEAVTGRDYGTIMALVLITAVIVLLANLLTDLAYAVVDPRIRYS